MEQNPYSPPEPLALTIAGTPDVVAYACGACRDVWYVHTIPGIDGAETLARRHCDRRCGACGHLRESARTYCPPCAERRERDRTAALLAKATKLSYDEWPGGLLYVDALEAYVDSWEELVDRCDEADVPVPAYAWACREERATASVDRVVDPIEEAFASDDGQAVSDAHAKRLQRYLTAWAATIPAWYVPDHTRAVLAPVLHVR